MIFREADIRPPGAMEALVVAASENLAVLGDCWEGIPCPACGGAGVFAFTKAACCYETCQECGSLFVSPRPQASGLAKFYEGMDAFGPFYASSAETRREAILRPRARMISDLAQRHGIHGTYCDIGCGTGELISMVSALNTFGSHYGIEPSPDAARAAQERGIDVAVFAAEAAPMWLMAGLTTAFEVLEHVFSPLDFLKAARRILTPGGILVFTTLACDGWDILELRAEHRAVCPPLHLNLLSLRGFEVLLKRAGLEMLELTTPGHLDVDIVRNALAERPGLPISGFAGRIAGAPEIERDAFQSFLRGNRMSSHVQIVARRPMDG